MSTLPQLSLFSWDEFDASPEILRLGWVLDALPDGALLDALARERKGRRNDYPLRTLWRSAIAGLMLGHATTSGLLRELGRNAELRAVCGFDEIRSVKAGRLVPPECVYSRFFGNLARHMNLIERMFSDLLRQVADLLPDFGTHLAMDSKALPVRGRCPEDGGVGTKEYEGSDGLRKLEGWVGYKLHLIVEAVHELPVAFEVSAAHVADSPRLMPMVEKLKEEHPEFFERTESMAGDKAYDDGADKARLYGEYGIVPLIPPRALFARSDEPLRPLDPKRHDTICKDSTGDVFCKIDPFETDPEKAFARMQFQGFEQDRGTLKFRCPAAAFGIECRNREACQCKPLVREGSHGRVVRVPLARDPRVFMPQHYHSRGFAQGYKRRTSVERVNSRLDRVHGFEETTVKGLDRMRLRVGLVLIVMLASAAAWVRAGKPENIRRLLRPAA